MKILDCTLRDGGYYTNWDFPKQLVYTYLHSTNNLPIDYLEIGYRSNPMNEYLGEYFYCPIYVLEELKSISNKKLVIILNEKDVRPEHVSELLNPCIGLIDMVRIALDPQHLGRALKLAEKIKKLGFEVGFNVMYMSKWKQFGNFLNEIKFVNDVAEYFYLVDSYGGVFPKDVKETISMVKERSDVKIGFHGHNNLEMALINTLTAIECGAEIVDGTFTGMGRGAGNLKTELLLTVLNATHDWEFDFNALGNVVDSFGQLQKHYEWGTNLPYMVSGANSLPQKDVMDWVTQRFYSFNSIIRALENQKNNVQDNKKFPIFDYKQLAKKVLIIGGGPGVMEHSLAITNFLKTNTDVALIHASSKNAHFFRELNNLQFFCLVGNEGYRLEKVFENLAGFNGTCILPPFPRKMGTYVPEKLNLNTRELDSIKFTDKYLDSHTAIALQSSIYLGAKEIFLVGYDGYPNNMNNKEMILFNENNYSFSKIKELEISVCSLLPTSYEVEVKSIYAQLL